MKIKMKINNNATKQLSKTIPKAVHSQLSKYVEGGEASKQLIQHVDPYVPVVTGRLRASAKWRWTNRHKHSRLGNIVTYNPYNPKGEQYYARFVELGGPKNIPKLYMMQGMFGEDLGIGMNEGFVATYKSEIVRYINKGLKEGAR